MKDKNRKLKKKEQEKYLEIKFNRLLSSIIDLEFDVETSVTTLLRKSIHLAYEMNHNQEEVDEVISGIVIESKFQSFEDNKLH